MKRFITITIFGDAGRYGAQLAGIDVPIWGATPEELCTNITARVESLSPTTKRELFSPLIEQQLQHAG